MDIRAAVFVGLPRSELACDELQDWIDNEDLEVCPPHYDGYRADHAIVGFELAGCGGYEPREFEWDEKRAQVLKERFQGITGKEAKVWISPYVY